MLKSLHVRNYVLIDSLDVVFPEGLIIITGQTGAGKSILLGALSLLMGAKADSSLISEGADNCVVEAEFFADNAEIRNILDENEVEWDNGNLIVRRVVSVSGRSRSFVNDSPVPVGVLNQLSSYLVDIHSQHQSLLLTDKKFQLSVLDHFAGNSELLGEFNEQFKAVQGLQRDLDSLEKRLARISSEKEYNEAQFRQLDAAGLREGELEELEQEQKRLANSEEIKALLCQVEECSLSSSLKDVSRALEKLCRFIPSYSELSDRFESSRIEVEDILDDLVSANEKMDVTPERLQFVEERMSLLYSLMKKHSCTSVSELIELRNRLSDELYDSSALELKLGELENSLEAARRRMDKLSSELHSARQNAIPSFAGSIEDSIHFLELEDAVFEVGLQQTEMGPAGSDAVNFRFSASGKNPVDVARCASGGEISRIMLCLKKMMAQYANMPTLFFDEIDTGVSGSVADKMGSMICDMGKNMQIFAITHLPQVAAKGDAHYLVSKSVGEKVVSSLEKLSGDQRVREIARMLSGSSITDAAVANAKSLLNII